MNRIVLLMITIFIVVLVVKFPHQMINPGPLQEAHAELDNSCNSCHAPFWGIPNANCITCHDPAEIGRDTNTAFQEQVLFHAELKDRSCVACHDDHKGRVPLVAINSFEHDMLGNIRTLKCTNCHAQPEDAMHTLVSTDCGTCHGTKSWASVATFDHAHIISSDKQNCVKCHAAPEDALHVSVTTTTCAKCHGTTAWSPATFDHDKYFVLDGDHNVRCSTCHTKGDFKAYTCYGCHEHSEKEMVSEHAEEGIYNITNCIKCHINADEDDAGHSIGDQGTGEHRKRREGGHEEEEEDDD